MGKRGPAPGFAKKGSPTGIRFPPDLKGRLTAAAADAKRTLSDEVAARLEMSFGAYDWFGDVETYALCQLIAHALKDVSRYSEAKWHSHPWSYEQAAAAVATLMGYFRPAETDGQTNEPLNESFTAGYRLGEVVAHQAVYRLEAVADHDDIREGGILDGDRLRVIAAGLRDRLVRAQMSGKAAGALDRISKEGSS